MSFTNSNWLGEMQDVSAAIDNEFGEAVTIIPCERKPNFQGLPQPEHAICEFQFNPATDSDLKPAAIPI